MKEIIKINKALLVFLSIIFLLSWLGSASALSHSYTDNTNYYIDTSGTAPDVWVKLDLPDWYDGSNVTMFRISMGGYDDNSSENIDVYLKLGTTVKKIYAWNPHKLYGFTKSWDIPINTIPTGTIVKTDFNGLELL